MDIGQLSDADLLSAIGKTPDIGSMSDADLLKAIGQPQQPEVSTTGDIAKSAGVGLGEGLLGVAGAPADLANLAAKGIDYATGTNLQSYTQPAADYAGSNALQGYVEKYTGPFYKPKTAGGDIARTVGQFAPAMVGGPETLATKFATRVAAPALASEAAGQVTKGTDLEPYARAAGAVVGAASPLALSRAISPVTADAVTANAVKTLENSGVQLTAGQKTGSKVLKYAESELGDALGSGGAATKANEKAAEQFTTSVLNKIPVTKGETRLTQSVFEKAVDQNSAKFDAVIDRNPVIKLDNNFMLPIQQVATDYEGLHGLGSAPILSNMAERINKAVTQTPSGPVIPGEAYQTLHSDLAKYARDAGTGYLRSALYDMRSELQSAVNQGLKGKDARDFAAARNEFRKLLVLERLVSGTSESAGKGLITPAALTNAEKGVYGRRNYATGAGPFSVLANAGNALMKPLPQSGTAPRAALHFLPSVIGSLVGSGVGAVPGALLGAVGPGILGRAILSKPVQSYLANQRGVGLRQIPFTKNAIKGAFLSLQGSQ